MCENPSYNLFRSKRRTPLYALVTGLDVATRGVANATSFYSVATKFSRLVANLAPKIGDFLLWVNVH